MAIPGCWASVSKPPDTQSDSSPPQVELLEGLPHHLEASFTTEKLRVDAEELHGYWFYSSSVEVDDQELQSIARILAAEGTFKKWMGEKLCDGFHPDWLVRLSGRDGPVTYMICFGCHEAKVIAGGVETRYDLSEAGYSGLAQLLKNRRINRPELKVGGNEPQ